MSTPSTFERHSRPIYFSAGVPDFFVEKRADGTAVVRGVKVFKVGTFRDSLGVQHTWNSEHLEQMVSNFNLLKANGGFPNVPVRVDHSNSVQNVIGYFQSLRFESPFLVADFEITEPDAVGKIERKTFRGRSAEINLFETNDEAMYWPVLSGTAFVDIPAVEGLFSKNPADVQGVFGDRPVAFIDQEAPHVQTPEQWTAAATYAQWVQDATYAQALADWENAANYAQALEDQSKAMKFRVNGAETVDFSAVQSHIDSLEKFAADTRDANRKAFVKGLVDAKKIGVTQEETLTAHALSLNEDQYATFVTSYSAAPVLSVFDRHGSGGTEVLSDKDAAADEVEVLEETVKRFRAASMTQEQIEQTPSFKRLAEIKAKAS